MSIELKVVSPQPGAPEWSPQQRTAITLIRDWHGSPSKPYFFLDGPAGTGKTTLLKAIGDTLGVTVAFASFTGKAAAVMRRKGCEDASTIHKLIYRPQINYWCVKEPPEDKFAVPCLPPCAKAEHCQYLRQECVGFELNDKSIAGEVDLIVIDEVSMVNEEMGSDLLSFGTPILVVGDTAQLPPVKGTGFFVSGKPDYRLTEIHRQKLDSPVLDLATRARQGAMLPCAVYGDASKGGQSRVTQRESVVEMLKHDVVIVGRHITRARINNAIREARGFHGPVPLPGEKVLAWKNNYQLGIMNGTIWIVRDAHDTGDGFYKMTIESEDEKGKVIDVTAPIPPFTMVNKCADLIPQFPGHPFTLGYALTCHKAQGSEWNSVYVIDESWCWKQNNQERHWLYTAIGRAFERVTVVKPQRW
jgi:exodeoxyribonuclease-5